ncbi:family 1 glycosylhydrolase [Deinococcus taeanensis]|uniref:family 1 glycosylhydrolase n=1 Tax=Deinococcus taeanensis TaxID=2737050 RepID=UPI001CDBB765|nr:family 1 glycosylhydrolase [Deinococcus taeanensis]UBV42153.1 family 1 glycosylhydrolase [Deinococcus taeanensis]
MTVTPGLFPTFFLSGFECSTFHWKRQGRRDLVAETHHDRCVHEDYALLRTLGIAVAREGIPWPLVEQDGQFDFSRLDPVLDAMNESQIMPIWDLCHYGYPDGLDPLSEEFAQRFARYCRAAAHHVRGRTPGPPCFTPINEITFFAFCGGEWGWVAPYLTGRENRFALRAALCRAAIAAARAIREVIPEARMVNVDPLVYVVPPADRPDLADEARDETFRDTFAAWDILAGRTHPEYGGSPDVLDIVGVNCYSFGQMEYREQGPHQALGPRDERIQPLAELLKTVSDRYGRPIIIAETSGLREGRPAWLKDVMEESLAAMARGIDLHGICLFPAVDMPDWHTGEWLHNGIFDLVPEGPQLRREAYGPYVDELRRWQKELNRVTELDEDPFSDPVNLEEVRAAARRLQLRPDRDWS